MVTVCRWRWSYALPAKALDIRLRIENLGFQQIYPFSSSPVVSATTRHPSSKHLHRKVRLSQNEAGTF